jgi:hypothetical protein
LEEELVRDSSFSSSPGDPSFVPLDYPASDNGELAAVDGDGYNMGDTEAHDRAFRLQNEMPFEHDAPMRYLEVTYTDPSPNPANADPQGGSDEEVRKYTS